MISQLICVQKFVRRMNYKISNLCTHNGFGKVPPEKIKERVLSLLMLFLLSVSESESVLASVSVLCVGFIVSVSISVGFMCRFYS